MFKSASKKALIELGLEKEQAETVRYLWSKASRNEVLKTGEIYGVTTYHGFVECWSYFRALVISAYLGNAGQNGFHGLEYLGENKRTGFDVHYLNTGDAYTSTLIFHNGTMRVSCWGDLVERGTV